MSIHHNCTSYKNTVTYTKKRVKMGGKNRCYSRASLKRRDGIWYHRNKKRYYSKNKKNPGPYAKLSKLAAKGDFPMAR